MQIKNKLFPYPVLNSCKNDSTFENSNYMVDYEMEESNDSIILKNVKIITDNQTIIKLIKYSKAKACLIIECPDTIYRENYSIGLEPVDIKLNKNNVVGTVFISGFIYANDNITEYSDIDFVEEYRDYSFEIDKFNVLAIDNGETLKIELNENIDKKISSILRVIENENSKETMEIAFDKNYILIYIPKKEYDIYYGLKNNDNFNNIFFSILAIPALTQALLEIRNRINNGESIDEIEFEFNWFISIEKAFFKNNNVKLDENIILTEDVNKIAQSLLNFGTIKAIDDIPILISGAYQTTDEGE